MRAEDDELVGLLAAAKLGNHVRCFERTANFVGDRKVGPNGMSGGEQTGDAFSIFAGDHDHRNAVNFSSHGVRVTVKKIMFSRGHEYDRFGFSLDRESDERRCLFVFSEEIVPCFKNRGVNQENFS